MKAGQRAIAARKQARPQLSGRHYTRRRALLDHIVSPAPSVMGPMRSSPPSDCHAAGLTLLSVVSAKVATLCCQRER
jgi:hypothetical protein